MRPDNVVRLSLPTKRLIAEGLMRRDELLKLLAWLERPAVRLAATPGGGHDLSGTERLVYGVLAEETSFEGMCQAAGLDPLSGARTVNRLRLIGAVTLTERESGAGAAAESDVRRGDAESVRSCVVAHLKVLSELAAPIVAVEGPAGLRERLDRVIDDASRRFPELLSDLEVGRGGVLDPEVVTERALRFPGDREREVCLAFGELISYLEFELVNHPKIEDPEVFVEAVEQLRSGL